MRSLLFALMLGCGGGETLDPSATAVMSGTVTLIEGDCTPTLDPPDPCRSSHVSRTVYLFPLQYFDESTHVFPTSVAVSPIAKTTSDSDGHYSMHAPPGRWSVFVEDNGHLYANNLESTDEGIAPVDLVDGVETTHDIEINHARD